jgi:hypothetical protein
MKRRAVLVMAILAFGAVDAAPARADHSPANCSRNALALDITKDRTVVRGGDVITYGVFIGNPGSDACDYTGVSVDFTVPGGQPQVVASIASLPSNTALHQIATVQYTVPTISGPVDLDAFGHAAGTIHDAPANHAGSVTKDLGTTAFLPAMVLTKIGSITSGVAPQTVTYTYTLTNTSPTTKDVPDIPIAGVGVGDDTCAPLAFVAGDANRDNLLNVGETWTFTCSTPYTAAGCHTNVATAAGNPTIDNRPTGAGPVSWTVCLTAPPKGAVKGARASSKRCVTLPSRSVKVRARELSTVRVRVRLNGKNIARSLVHVSGAGISKRARTNGNGMVTFHVRPKKTGRLRISSDQCAVAARLSVKPPRQVVSPALPEVTG